MYKNTLIKNALLATVLGAALQGCDYFLPGNVELERYVSYSSDYDGDKIVMNGYITDGHGVYADLSRTYRPEDKRRADTAFAAKVTLLEDGKAIATLHAQKERRLTANYCERFTHYLLPGEVSIERRRRYSLRAESRTLGTAESAQCTVPSGVEIDSVWAETSYRGKYLDFYAHYHGAADGLRTHPFMRSYRYGKCHTRSGWFDSKKILPPDDGSGVAQVENSGYNRYTDSVSVEVLTMGADVQEYLKSWRLYEESSADYSYEYPIAVIENVDGGHGFVGAYAVSGMTIIADEANSVVGEGDRWGARYDSLLSIDYYTPFDWTAPRE